MTEAIDFYKPIPPVKPTDGWRQVPIIQGSPFHERLVPLGMFAGPEHRNIFTDAMYFGERKTSPYKLGDVNGALIVPFVRKSVAEALVHANHLLPPQHALVVWDAFRPEKVQRALFDDFHGQLLKLGYSKDDATRKAQEFVSIPSTDPLHPSPHITGGSVDLGIVRFEKSDWDELKSIWKTWQGIRDENNLPSIAELKQQQLFRDRSILLDMGIEFDEVSEKTALRYFEEKLERGEKLPVTEHEQLLNRRLLSNVMNAAGFADYPHEPWHKDLGNQFWAHQKGTSAVFGVADFSAQNTAFEAARVHDYHCLTVFRRPKESPVGIDGRLAMPLRIVSDVFTPDYPGRHSRGHRLDATALG